MAGTFKFGALGTYTTVIAGASVAPSLKNLASGAAILSNEIDNSDSAKRNILALFDLYVRGASAFVEGSFLAGYYVLTVDGTNYADGASSGPVIPATAPDLIFPVRTVATQQRVALHNQLLPNCKFKVLIHNASTIALTNTDNENILSYRPYNYAVDA